MEATELDVREPVVAFVGVEPSAALSEYALSKVTPLLDLGAVHGCRIVLEGHNHAHAGSRFRSKIEMSMPGSTLVAGSEGEAFSDVYAAIDDTALVAFRLLREHVARRIQAGRRAARQKRG